MSTCRVSSNFAAVQLTSRSASESSRMPHPLNAKRRHTTSRRLLSLSAAARRSPRAASPRRRAVHAQLVMRDKSHGRCCRAPWRGGFSIRAARGGPFFTAPRAGGLFLAIIWRAGPQHAPSPAGQEILTRDEVERVQIAPGVAADA